MKHRLVTRLAATLLLALPLTTACAAEPSAPVALPRPDLAGKVTLTHAIQVRRSVREYAPGALTLAEIKRRLEDRSS